MNEFLNAIERTAKLKPKAQLDAWKQVFDLDPTSNQTILQLYQDNLDFKTISDRVEKLEIFNNEWLAFNEAVISFIRLCNQFNPWSMLESFDLYGKFLEDLSAAFSHQRGWCLSQTIKFSIGFIFPMAKQLDLQLHIRENQRKPRLSWLAGILLRIFNNIRSQTNEENIIKSTILLFIGNKLCQVYFQINNPLLCRNVFTNVNSLNLDVRKYDKFEILTYRYYLAKFYLIKNQLIDGYQHLNWCLINSPVIIDHPNITKIIQLLVPVGILIGKRPNFRFLNQTYFSTIPKFMTIFQQMSTVVNLGDLGQFNKLIQFNFTLLKKMSLFIVLESKSTILMVRNLFYNTWRVLNKPLTIKFELLIISLQLSKFPYDIDDNIVENLLVSLIDQNYLKGKVLPRLKVVSLAKVNVFPKVDQINFVKFGNSDEWTLNANDKWLQI